MQPKGICMALEIGTQTARRLIKITPYHLRTVSKPIDTSSSRNRAKETKCTGYKMIPTILSKH